jgi:hypothetical protein
MQEDYIDDALAEFTGAPPEEKEVEVPEGGLRNCPACQQPMKLAARINAREMLRLMRIAKASTLEQAQALHAATMAVYLAFISLLPVAREAQGLWEEHHLTEMQADIVLSLVEGREARAERWAKSRARYATASTTIHSGIPPPATTAESPCVAA